MGSSKPSVYIPGFLFANLIRDAGQCSSQKEGLLIGESKIKIVDTVTDSHSSGVKEDFEITIQDSTPCFKTFSFYNHLGHIDQKKLNNQLYKQEENFIGWYMFRKNTRTTISMREHAVIKRLLANDIGKSKYLIFLLITPSLSDNGAALQFSYKCFVCKKDSSPEAVNLKIINLGDQTYCKKDYVQHSRLVGTRSRPSSGCMGTILDTYVGEFLSPTGSVKQVDATQRVFFKAQGTLKELSHKLLASDAKIAQYEKRIELLKARCMQKYKNRRLLEESGE